MQDFSAEFSESCLSGHLKEPNLILVSSFSHVQTFLVTLKMGRGSKKNKAMLGKGWPDVATAYALESRKKVVFCFHPNAYGIVDMRLMIL